MGFVEGWGRGLLVIQKEKKISPNKKKKRKEQEKLFRDPRVKRLAHLGFCYTLTWTYLKEQRPSCFLEKSYQPASLLRRSPTEVSETWKLKPQQDQDTEHSSCNLRTWGASEHEIQPISLSTRDRNSKDPE